MDEFEATVRAVRPVGPDTIAIEFDTPDGFTAAPGQFVRVTATVADEEVSRFYTISSPDVAGSFEVTIGIDPEGTFGPWIADRDAGDTLQVKGPFGNSYYEGEERVVVLAGGPGVGPAVGIGERVLNDGGEVAIVYRDDEPAHEDRLAALSNAGAEVFLVANGIEDAVPAALSAVGGQVFIYGFADFLDDALDALTDAGFDPDAAKIENFG
ncbi:FAD-dependent oxidoreductase [Halobacteriaceae archaeon GCM10025711]